MEVHVLKAKVDIVDVVGRYVALKKQGRVFKGLCPFHAERTPSFVVYPETQTWHCYGACNAGGDVFSFVQRAEDWDFKQVIDYLGGGDFEQTVTPRSKLAMPVVQDIPSEKWLTSVAEVSDFAQNMLWSDKGKRALAYLQDKRGLSDDIIRTYQLGYVPGHYTQWMYKSGLTVPCGITIPHLLGGKVVGIKVRRSAGNIKYQQVKGSRPVLYGVDHIRAGVPIVIDEGELNALTIAQATNKVVAVALGSASNVKVINEYYERLLFSKVFLRMDENRAGETARATLLAISQRFKVVNMPEGYDDPNHLWVNDKHRFWDWLKALTDEYQKTVP